MRTHMFWYVLRPTAAKTKIYLSTRIWRPCRAYYGPKLCCKKKDSCVKFIMAYQKEIDDFVSNSVHKQTHTYTCTSQMKIPGLTERGLMHLSATMVHTSFIRATSWASLSFSDKCTSPLFRIWMQISRWSAVPKAFSRSFVLLRSWLEDIVVEAVSPKSTQVARRTFF